MGVPVLSLVGEHHASRVGYSLLTRLGLDDFVAHREQEYVDKAVCYARQREALAEIRWALRPRMLRSSLCDVGGFCRALERAYRDMWCLRLSKESTQCQK